jgi:hypothetical protein
MAFACGRLPLSICGGLSLIYGRLSPLIASVKMLRWMNGSADEWTPGGLHWNFCGETNSRSSAEMCWRGCERCCASAISSELPLGTCFLGCLYLRVSCYPTAASLHRKFGSESAPTNPIERVIVAL